MKRLALAGCVCLCGCAMSVMGAEALSSGSDDMAGLAAVIEATAVDPEPIPKDGAEMAADPRYVLLSVPMEDEVASGLYLLRDSIRVTDVVKDSLFVEVKVYDAWSEGVMESIWRFRLDGDGMMYHEQLDGTYQALSENALESETLAADCIREELANEAKRELFIQEIQEIAIRKAHLDVPEESSAENGKSVSEEAIRLAFETKKGKKENISVIRKGMSGETALWKELEKRAQSAFRKEKSIKTQGERTRIDVVISPDSDVAYEEKEVEPDNQAVTVSIQSAQS